MCFRGILVFACGDDSNRQNNLFLRENNLMVTSDVTFATFYMPFPALTHTQTTTLGRIINTLKLMFVST